MSSLPPDPDRASAGRSRRRLRAAFCADVANFSGRVSVSETHAFGHLSSILKVGREELTRYEGQLIGMPGDGLFALFESAVDAVTCALVLQSRLAEHQNLGGMRLRIGIHLGDVLFDGDLPFGETLNIAARLQALADPGGTLVSGAVVDAVSARVAATFEDRGVPALKNIPRRIATFAVKPRANLADPETTPPFEPLDQTMQLPRRGSLSASIAEALGTTGGGGARPAAPASPVQTAIEPAAPVRPPATAPQSPPLASMSLSQAIAATTPAGSSAMPQTLAAATEPQTAPASPLSPPSDPRGWPAASAMPPLEPLRQPPLGGRSASEADVSIEHRKPAAGHGHLTDPQPLAAGELPRLSARLAEVVTPISQPATATQTIRAEAPVEPAPPYPHVAPAPPPAAAAPVAAAPVANAPVAASPVPPAPVPATPYRSILDAPPTDESLELVAELLAIYLGPVARLMTIRQAKSAASLGDLIASLEASIPTPAERHAFRTYVRQGLGL
ncbi:MAG: adenylate/guanylate cyclase domain-containing protein [Hyphomicrobiaceae bacterium]|nr:adenylate/guanylate cyclase domain-containing protein [Hyphomicrobiaceae bacterium]